MEQLLYEFCCTGIKVNHCCAQALQRHQVDHARQLKCLDDMLYALFLEMKAGFNLNQPRLPAGQPGGGQWTSDPAYLSQRYKWGKWRTLRRHAKIHGKKLDTHSIRDYARKAQLFRERAIRQKLPSVIDMYGTTRYYDPKRNIFGSYNKDGTTRTFYKPRAGIKYFENQIRDALDKGGRVIHDLPESERGKPKTPNAKPKPGGRGGGGGGGLPLRDKFPLGFKPTLR